jgi:hypothetical protein
MCVIPAPLRSALFFAFGVVALSCLEGHPHQTYVLCVCFFFEAAVLSLGLPLVRLWRTWFFLLKGLAAAAPANTTSSLSMQLSGTSSLVLRHRAHAGFVFSNPQVSPVLNLEFLLDFAWYHYGGLPAAGRVGPGVLFVAPFARRCCACPLCTTLLPQLGRVTSALFARATAPAAASFGRWMPLAHVAARTYLTAPAAVSRPSTGPPPPPPKHSRYNH